MSEVRADSTAMLGAKLTLTVATSEFHDVIFQRKSWIGQTRNRSSRIDGVKAGDFVLLVPDSSDAPASAASAGSGGVSASRDWVRCEVLEDEVYDSFESMVNACGLHACQPDAVTVQEAVAKFRQQSRMATRESRGMIGGVAVERSNGGVLGLKLKPLQSKAHPF